MMLKNYHKVINTNQNKGDVDATIKDNENVIMIVLLAWAQNKIIIRTSMRTSIMKMKNIMLKKYVNKVWY